LVVEEGSFCSGCGRNVLGIPNHRPKLVGEGDRGGVQVRMEEKYDVIHSMLEIGELCQGSRMYCWSVLRLGEGQGLWGGKHWMDRLWEEEDIDGVGGCEGGDM